MDFYHDYHFIQDAPTEDMEVIGDLPPKMEDSVEGETMCRTNSSTDLKEHISLTIPEGEGLARSPSEASLPQSETWEDESVTSQPSTTESHDISGSKDDFVNPRGVRFIPHHGHSHEGMCLK